LIVRMGVASTPPATAATATARGIAWFVGGAGGILRLRGRRGIERGKKRLGSGRGWLGERLGICLRGRGAFAEAALAEGAIGAGAWRGSVFGGWGCRDGLWSGW
jgi:hypothetical protein